MEGKPERLTELCWTTKRRAYTEQLLHVGVKLRKVTGASQALDAKEKQKLQLLISAFNIFIKVHCNIIKDSKY